MAKEYVMLDKWFGGMSQDDLYTKEGEYSYSENVNTKSKSDHVHLNRDVGHLFTTNGNDMLSSTSIKDGSVRTFFFGEDGEVYYDGSNDDVPLYTTSNTDTIYDSTSFDGVLYFVERKVGSAFSLHGISEEDAFSLDWIGNVNSFLQTGAQPDEAIMLNYQNIGLYVGAGKRLYIYSKTDVVSGLLTEFIDFKSNIKGITYTGSLIKIYTEDGNVTFIDSLNYTVETVINIKVSPKIVKTIKGIDYIIGGYSTYDSQLLIMEGYSVNVLAKSTKGIRNKFDFSTRSNNVLEFDGRQIYFAGLLMNPNNNEGIISYGTEKVGLPEGYNNEVTKVDLSSGVQEDIDLVSLIQANEGKLYFGYDGVVNGQSIGVVDLTTVRHTQNGTLITKKFNAGSSLLNKDLVEIEIWGEFNGNIKVTTIIDGDEKSEAFTDWVVLDNDNDITEPVRISSLASRFNNISLKFQFDGAYQSQTPDMLYGAKIDYNVTRT